MMFSKLSKLALILPSFLFIGCGQYESLTDSNSESYSFNGGTLKAADFIDTGANHSLDVSEQLFQFDDSAGVMMVSTASELSNIHSHYSQGRDFSNYTYSGSMMVSDVNSKIGVTLLSDYPNSDNYYQLANDSSSGSFQLSARHTLSCQEKDSNISVKPGEWYSFKILVKADSAKTALLVKVWPSFAREPFDAQINCIDTSDARRVQGTVGLSASGAGTKHWADLFIGFDPYLAPTTPPTTTPKNCAVLAHGETESRTRFQALTVPQGSTCQSEVQTRTCVDGQLSSFAPNTYQYDACAVEPAQPPVGSEVSIASVSASSDDGNVPSNILDGDFSTRWSASGDGEFIDLNFDALYTVDRLEVAFHKGDRRTNRFDVELLIDGNFVQILSDQESTMTLDLIPFMVNNNQKASALRLVGHGNSSSTWNSITELKVYGQKVGELPTPPIPPVTTPKDCTALAHDETESRTRFQALTVPQGSSCQSEIQTRTCTDGELSAFTPNNFQFSSCSIDTPTPPPSNGNLDEPIYDVSNKSGLMQALSVADGGTIRLAAGNYGKFQLNHKSGFNVKYSKPLTIVSKNPSNPASFSWMLLGQVENLHFNGILFNYKFKNGDVKYTRAFEIKKSKNITIKNSEFRGDNATSGGEGVVGLGIAQGLNVSDSENVTLENNEFSTFHRALIVGDSIGVTVRKNDVHSCRSDGFDFYAVRDTVIEDNHIHDFIGASGPNDHRDFIQFWTNGTSTPSVNVTIRNNLLDIGQGSWAQSIFIRNEEVDNGRAGTEMYYRNFVIENNIILNTHLHGITVGESDGLVVKNNKLVSIVPNTDDAANAALVAKYGPRSGLRVPMIRMNTASKNVRIEDNGLYGAPEYSRERIVGYENQSDWIFRNNEIRPDLSAADVINGN